MTQLFVFTNDSKLIGDLHFDVADDMASAIEKWASYKRIEIPRFAFVTHNLSGEGERWTVIDTNPIKLITGVTSVSRENLNIVANSSRHNEILLKILEAQGKQLYWIRIIGIPFLLAAIGSFLALVIRMFN
jgi:hypothetical protein